MTRGFAVSLIVAAVLATAQCAPATSQSSGAGPATAPPAAAPAEPRASAAPAGSLRERWLEMFARGYFPGRSGQIFVVPREGEVITERDPLYKFMHGSPWDYDTHIPLLFYGAPFIRQGQWRDAVSQQDIAPTLGALIGAAPRCRPTPAAC